MSRYQYSTTRHNFQLCAVRGKATQKGVFLSYIKRLSAFIKISASCWGSFMRVAAAPADEHATHYADDVRRILAPALAMEWK